MKAIAPTLLVIMDGFGYSFQAEYNAIHHAHTPNFDHWLHTYPHTLLDASGTAVGLLPGMIGNSEVGHLTIGSGRRIASPVLQLHQAIDNKSFFKHETLLKYLHNFHGRLHIMGLLSDAGVHSHEKHLYALLAMAGERKIPTFIHAFLDGRDVPPRSAERYLKALDQFCNKEKFCAIGSVHGRFYAMDRDKNWDRTEQSYRTLTEKKETTSSWQNVLKESYRKKVFDEFIVPTQLHKKSTIQDGDGIIFFNFRPDRARQLTQCFVAPTTIPFKTKSNKLHFFVTATTYDPLLKTDELIQHKTATNTLKDVLSKNNKTIFTIAETEKYAHVTYFFNGGREAKVKNEKRVLIPSIKAATYREQPEMSARKITDAVLKSLKTDTHDFYLINYANADMVGHSGDFEATKKAVVVIDRELKRLYDEIIKQNGTMFITADHGNAEDMIDTKVGQVKTSHSTNKVPFIFIQKALAETKEKLPLTELAHIASFILRTMNIKVPHEMNHQSPKKGS